MPGPNAPGPAACAPAAGAARWLALASWLCPLMTRCRFAERLLALLDATRYSATYKLAALLALVDVPAERTGRGGLAPAVVPARDVARRVIELYWPQTVPYGAADARNAPRVLSQAAQNDIPAKLAAWQSAHGLDGRGQASVMPARPTRPGWAVLEADLSRRRDRDAAGQAPAVRRGTAVRVEDQFIYDFSWPEEVGRAARGPARF